jgi:type IV pilus assembly protein PilF
MARYKYIILSLGIATLLTGCSNRPSGIMALTDAQMDAQAAVELINIDHVNSARSKANQAIAMDSNAPSPWYVLGYINEATGDIPAAEKDFKHAIRVKRDSGTAHNNYGTFLCHQNRIDDAINQFNIAAQEPHFYNADTTYENAGLCLQRAGKLAQAREYFIKAVDLNPYLSHSLFELAVINYQLHDYDDARIYLKEYLSTVQKPGPISKTLQAYLKKKHHPPFTQHLPAPMQG